MAGLLLLWGCSLTSLSKPGKLEIEYFGLSPHEYFHLFILSLLEPYVMMHNLAEYYLYLQLHNFNVSNFNVIASM